MYRGDAETWNTTCNGKRTKHGPSFSEVKESRVGLQFGLRPRQRRLGVEKSVLLSFLP